jgi:hypothetical protein
MDAWFGRQDAFPCQNSPVKRIRMQKVYIPCSISRVSGKLAGETASACIAHSPELLKKPTKKG